MGPMDEHLTTTQTRLRDLDTPTNCGTRVASVGSLVIPKHLSHGKANLMCDANESLRTQHDSLSPSSGSKISAAGIHLHTN